MIVGIFSKGGERERAYKRGISLDECVAVLSVRHSPSAPLQVPLVSARLYVCSVSMCVYECAWVRALFEKK